MSETSKSEALRVNVTKEMRELVTGEAERDDVSEAHVVRRALRFYFDSKKEEQHG